MKAFAKLLTLTAFALAVSVVWGSEVGAPTAYADDKDNKPVAQAQPKKQEPAKSKYAFVAQPGDSYTKIARKAVQIYGINNKVNLTQAGIVFAETNLTNKAGSPELEVGQNVEVAEADLKEWVDKAKNLTAEEQANWAVYAANVDFNTNDVGEAR